MEHAIQFGIVVSVHVVLVALLEILLDYLADGGFVEYNVVFPVGFVLSKDGRVCKHQRPGQHSPFACFGELLWCLCEGLEWSLNRWHIGQGHELDPFIHLVHGHPVNG